MFEQLLDDALKNPLSLNLMNVLLLLLIYFFLYSIDQILPPRPVKPMM